jgi:DNA repair protein RadC
MEIQHPLRPILNSQQAYQYLRGYLTADVEEVWALALDSCTQARRLDCIFRGTVDACLIHPRDIFRFGCQANASSLILAHNHPSNDLMPSDEDIRFTKKIVQLGLMMEMPIRDHLILGSYGYVSLADLHMCGFKSRRRSMRG